MKFLLEELRIKNLEGLPEWSTSVRDWITLQVTFSIVSQVWAFVSLKCCFVLVSCVFGLSWGEKLCLMLETSVASLYECVQQLSVVPC